MSKINGIVDRLDDHGKRYDHIDPSKIRLLHDRCLVRDLGAPAQHGLIHVPDTANKGGVDEYGYTRIGLVIATGPGDKFVEMGIDAPDALGYHNVRRKLITQTCDTCNGMKHIGYDFYQLKVVGVPFGMGPQCAICGGEGIIPVTMEPQCKPGERVLYDRRREMEFVIFGQRFLILNAEQSIYGVLED